MKITQKLKSTTGASLLIALVFMLFCTFVGGAVLAASTANAGRIKSVKADEQAYLDQRSAAVIIADEFSSKSSMTLSITEQTETRANVIVQDGIEVITSSADTKMLLINISDDETDNNFKRLLYETAVLKYLINSDFATENTKIRSDYFGFSGEHTVKEELSDNFMLYSSAADLFSNKAKLNSCSIDFALGDQELPSMYFVCNDPKVSSINSIEGSSLENEDYSIGLDFGPDSMVSIQMPAVCRYRIPTPTQPPVVDGVRTSVVKNTLTVKWYGPNVVKGPVDRAGEANVG